MSVCLQCGDGFQKGVRRSRDSMMAYIGNYCETCQAEREESHESFQ